MESTYSLLFYLKKEKGYTDGPITIQGRITVDGDIKEFSTGQKCDPHKWEDGNLSGRTEDVKSLKKYLETITLKIRDHHRVLLTSTDFVSASMLRDSYQGKRAKTTSLHKIFQEHNTEMAELVKVKKNAPGTLERYKTSLSHTMEFIKWKYNESDMDIRRIDHQFVVQYDFYLRTIRKCSNNTTVKYIKNFKKIIRICLDNRWITSNPFALYKAKIKKIKPVPLGDSDIIKLIKKQFQTFRLEQIRDIFIFCCFTGLAYADVKKLKRDNLFIGVDGKVWLDSKRKKTEGEAVLPLLTIAAFIVKKYLYDPFCVRHNVVLPVISNQKMNEYLSEIGNLCEINKKITTHTARHTFATTVTLSRSVPLETVSAMLGHEEIRSTQHYAQVLPDKVSREMEALDEISPITRLIPAQSVFRLEDNDIPKGKQAPEHLESVVITANQSALTEVLKQMAPIIKNPVTNDKASNNTSTVDNYAKIVDTPATSELQVIKMKLQQGNISESELNDIIDIFQLMKSEHLVKKTA